MLDPPGKSLIVEFTADEILGWSSHWARLEMRSTSQ